MTEKNKLIGCEMLTDINREVTIPLNSILSLSYILRDEMEQDRHKAYIDAIIASGRSVLDMMENLSVLYQIEVGQHKITLAYESIHAVISQLMKDYQKMAVEKGISFKIIIDCNVPQSILMDEAQMSRVLVHILSNAIKYTEKGSVTLLVEAKNFREEENKMNLILRVVDTGIGVSKEDQNIIVNPFTQAMEDSSQKYNGLGIGLTLVKNLTEMMNGSMDIESDIGKGTKITLEFSDVQYMKNTHDQNELEDCKDTEYSNETQVFLSVEEKLQLLEKLDQEFIPRFRKLQKGIVTSQARQFALGIRELGEQYRYQVLLYYSEKLLSHVDSFEVQKTKRTLDGFQTIYDFLKGGV